MQHPQQPGYPPQQPAPGYPPQGAHPQAAATPLPAVRDEWTISKGKTGQQIKLTVPPFRLSYPNLKEPATYQGQDTGKYQFEALYPEGEDVSSLADAIEWVGQTMWGPNWRQMAEGHALHPARSKMSKETGLPRDGYDHGGFICIPKSKRPVPILARRKDPQTGKWLPAEDNEIYPGCWCVAAVNIYPYTSGRMGVSLNLLSVMKWKDDSPFTTGGNPEEDFAAITEETPQEAGFTAPQPAPGYPPQQPAPGYPPQQPAPGYPPHPTQQFDPLTGETLPF